jgi:hypothetical protein
MNKISSSTRRDLVSHLLTWKRIFSTSELRWVSQYDIKKLANVVDNDVKRILEFTVDEQFLKGSTSLENFISQNKTDLEAFVALAKRSIATTASDDTPPSADGWKLEHEQLINSYQSLAVSFSKHVSKGVRLAKQHREIAPRLRLASKIYNQVLSNLRGNMHK